MAYAVDIALLVDSTGSMVNAIDYAKNHALNFHQELSKAMEACQKSIEQLRIRVISFRDYYHDSESTAMVTSEFFNLPEQESEFKEFVDQIQAAGGGPEPECSLEAIALAMRSEWDKGSEKARHILVLWTDASAHALEEDNKPHYYPADLPTNFKQLTTDWGQLMNGSAKRLIMFAPNKNPWPQIADNWENTIHYESTAGQGLEDVDYKVILNTIANSI